MICLKCGARISGDAVRCVCGYRFGDIRADELDTWYQEYRAVLEPAYLAAGTPWMGSGKSGSFEEWTRLRVPVCECIEHSGSFLDIGCANGFLLECLIAWTRLKGVEIIPFGLDISNVFVDEARRRLPRFSENIMVGNALYWKPPQKFDYVRTELDYYIPRNFRQEYLQRLLKDFVVEGGKLLLAHYRSSREDRRCGWIDEQLTEFGITPERVVRGFSSDGMEKTRIAVVENK